MLQRTANDYQILVEPVTGWVEARRGSTLVARSRRARVMHETRLPPVIYFPKSDIVADLIPAADRRTFCPFKGTASYLHVKIGDDVVEHGAWCYQNALPEGRAVDGYVAFMPDAVPDYALEDMAIDPMPGGNIAGPTVDWLLRDASTLDTPETLTAAIGRKLVEDGIAVSRLGVFIWSLHPMIAGRFYLWTRDDDHVESVAGSHEQLAENPEFQNSPLRHVSNGLGGVRQRLDANPDEFTFAVMEDLRAQGATDYVAMPLPFSNGQINVMTLASDHPDGFTTPNLGLVFECSAIVSRLYEVFALRANATALLETYLGKRTGARVLGGEIRRGDGDVIDAAILFCDLRGSTRLETDLGRTAYVDLLNHFFEVTTDLVNAEDGEVLKFIGDAVLAIFPETDGPAEACRRAVACARKVAAALERPQNGAAQAVSCGIGIAFGEVTYGNVGSRERLDFTVIGAAANLAARLSDHGKRMGHSIVVTKDVTDGRAEDPIPLGALSLHNIAEPVEAFALGG